MSYKSIVQINWYLNRVKTFSIPELIYRLKQKAEVITERKTIHLQRSRLNKYPEPLLNDKLHQTNMELFQFELFGEQVNINSKIAWLQTQENVKAFPRIKYNKINTRSNQFGDVKYTWEINRLQFLIPMLFSYHESKDEKILLSFMEIIESWSKENPYLIGVNWYSNIEVNIRLIIWFLCWNILDVEKISKQNRKFEKFVENVWSPLIYSHCVYSYKHPSKYSSANNHLIAEAAGLFIASSFWEFEDSQKWLKHSKEILEQEIVKQHSPNGINKEEAGEYIHFIMDFFLLSYIVGEKTNNTFSVTFKNMLQNIVEYMFHSTDNNCNYPRYGDDDDGYVLLVENEKHNNFCSLLISGAILFNEPKYKLKAGEIDSKNMFLFGVEGKDKYDELPSIKAVAKSKMYPEEGHFYIKHLSAKSDIYFHFNAAQLGYLSIAAHGHADALSFEMRLNNKEIFIDPGTYSYYGYPEWRNYFRSTLAHNTISIDFEDQAKQAGPMFWLNPYQTEILECSLNEKTDFVKAKHDGYREKGIEHIRSINFDKQELIFYISDEIKNSKQKEVVILIPFHIHPSVTIKQLDNKTILLNDNLNFSTESNLNYETINGNLNPKLGWYSKSYGYKEATNTILFKTKTNDDFSNQFTIQIKE